MKAKLYIVRGIPGSGKSTFARKMLDKGMAEFHFEADMFFLNKDGKYVFDQSRLHAAHKWCEDQVRQKLNAGKQVVVSNTFTTLKEIRPYVDFCIENGIPYQVIRLNTRFGSIHNVPSDTLKKMEARFQIYPGEMVISG